MDMDQSAVFLAGSILTMLGFIIFVIGVVIINNIIAKYWKPVKWVNYEYASPRFVTPEELAEVEKIAPKFDSTK